MIGFYNPDEKCLQRGTEWVFKSDKVSSLKGSKNSIVALTAQKPN